MEQSQQQAVSVGRWAKRVQRWVLGGMAALVVAGALALPNAASANQNQCEYLGGAPGGLGYLHPHLNGGGEGIRFSAGNTELNGINAYLNDQTTSLCIAPFTTVIVFRDFGTTKYYRAFQNTNAYSIMIGDLRQWNYRSVPREQVGSVNDSISWITAEPMLR